MKIKKILVFLFFCIVVIVFIKKNRQDKVGPLLFKNIEAIAGDEHAENVHCAGVGSLDCPISTTKVKTIYGGYSLEMQY